MPQASNLQGWISDAEAGIKETMLARGDFTARGLRGLVGQWAVTNIENCPHLEIPRTVQGGERPELVEQFAHNWKSFIESIRLTGRVGSGGSFFFCLGFIVLERPRERGTEGQRTRFSLSLTRGSLSLNTCMSFMKL
uniref:Uncharacterized protein n=1 Tax=Opuntia streptacantha TaxID=393608 RepID=A0A7C8ZCH0_OPUST